MEISVLFKNKKGEIILQPTDEYEQLLLSSVIKSEKKMIADVYYESKGKHFDKTKIISLIIKLMED